jgi:hypothetical protein
MKCINQSKEDGRIQAIVLNKDVKKHFITTFIKGKYELPKFEITQPEIKLAIDIDEVKSKKFNIGELPKMVLNVPNDIDIENMTSNDILTLLPLNKDFDHTYTHLVARFCFYNEISFDDFLSWLRNKHADSNI